MTERARASDLTRVEWHRRLQSALQRWREVLGAEHVVDSRESLREANQATFGPSGVVDAIIRPLNTLEVQACMRIAHETKVAVHPVSRGRNWGYGSRTPPQDSVVLMELGRMNEILEYDEELAFVRVQPGVTFQQLWEFLEAKESSLQMDATSGPRDGSMLGNALERGRSHGPAMAAARSVGDLQVVLADGRVIHTSSRRFPKAAHAACEPFPLGPDTSGIFFESNLGVVTEMTVLLTRKAKVTRVLLLALRDEESLRRVVGPIRALMMDGILFPQSVLMINDFRRRSESLLDDEYRRGEGGGDSAATGSTTVSGAAGLPRWPREDYAWLCNVTVYASDEMIADRRVQIVKESLSRHADAVFEATMSNVGARPNPEPMRIPYSKKGLRAPSSPDLDRDRVGYIFVAPLAPAKSDEICDVNATLRELMLASGFDPLINLRFWDARSVIFVASIVYDLDDEEADLRAKRCYEQLLVSLAQKGYLPYRLPTFAMQSLPRPVDDWGSFWGQVKKSLDPHDVLSPGRYDFRYCWPKTSDLV